MKSDIFVTETFLDQTILQHRTPEILSPRVFSDKKFHEEFDKLETLAVNLDQALHQAHFQQSVELSAITIAAAFVKPQPIHSVLASPSSSSSSITSPPII